MEEFQTKEITITCEDQYELAGTLYIPKQAIRSCVMIASATGIKRQFYTSFSKYLCQNGHVVLCFDYRGIGGSKGDNINESEPSLTKWGQLDMTAALDFLIENFPQQEYHLLGHSAGGQLVGLMSNSLALSSMVNYGSSSGSLKNFKLNFKLVSHFFMNFYIPLNNLLFGHTKSQWVGMGEPLPKNVGKEWRRWCNGSGYVARDLGSKIKDHNYDKLNINSLWIYSTDDNISTLANLKEMVNVYKNIKSKIITLEPDDYGFSHIGHMKFFSSKKAKLWPIILSWLQEDYKKC